MRRSSVLLVGAVVVCVFGGWIVGRSNPPATTMAIERRAEIDAGMDRIVASVDFQNTPLEKVIATLRDQTKTNLVGDWNTLEAAGIEKQTPISCRLTNLPLSRVLNVVAMLTTPGNGLVSAEVIDGVIEFSTTESQSRFSETRVYDVRDLVEADLRQRQKWETATPSTQPAISNASSGSVPVTYAQSIDNLKQLISNTIAPDSWRNNGGSIGSIDEFGGMLIITETPQTCVQIEELLAKLRVAIKSGDAKGSVH